jgi:hypothetical protein
MEGEAIRKVGRGRWIKFGSPGDGGGGSFVDVRKRGELCRREEEGGLGEDPGSGACVSYL